MIWKSIYTHNKDNKQIIFMQWVKEAIIINLLSNDAGLFNKIKTPLNNILFTFTDLNTIKRKIGDTIKESFGDWLIIKKIDITQLGEKIEVSISLEIPTSIDNPLIKLYDLSPKQNLYLKLVF